MNQLRFNVGQIGSVSAAVQWSKNLTIDQQLMAQDATNAFRDAADLVVTRGRSDIAAAGFSVKWQNAWKAKVYPEKGYSLGPALYAYHKIQYSNVFETGAHIKGQQGFLWLPVAGLPTSFSHGERLTPLTFERATGQDLVPFRNPKTGNLLLGVRIKVPARSRSFKLSLTRLRRGTDAPKGVEQLVPVFVGIRAVTIPSKFHLENVFQTAVAELPALYDANKGRA